MSIGHSNELEKDLAQIRKKLSNVSSLEKKVARAWVRYEYLLEELTRAKSDVFKKEE